MDKQAKPKKIPFFPDLFMAEVMVTALVLAAFFLATALGYQAPLEEQADPFLTPAHAAAPWYFLFLQGLLKILPKIVGAVLAPIIILGAAFGLPYIVRGPASARRGRIALVVVIILFIIWAVLTYIGSPAYAV